jgi:hypothetical protein
VVIRRVTPNKFCRLISVLGRLRFQGGLLRDWWNARRRFWRNVVAPENRIVDSVLLRALLICAVVCWTLFKVVDDGIGIGGLFGTLVFGTKVSDVILLENIDVGDRSPDEQTPFVFDRIVNVIDAHWNVGIEGTSRRNKGGNVLQLIEIPITKLHWNMVILSYARASHLQHVGRWSFAGILKINYNRWTSYFWKIFGKRSARFLHRHTSYEDPRALISLIGVHGLSVQQPVDAGVADQYSRSDKTDYKILALKTRAIFFILLLLSAGWWSVNYADSDWLAYSGGAAVVLAFYLSWWLAPFLVGQQIGY